MKSMNVKNIWEDITSEEEKLEMDYLEKTLLGNIDKIIDRDPYDIWLENSCFCNLVKIN